MLTFFVYLNLCLINALLYLPSYCRVAVSAFSAVGLWSVIVAFPGHDHYFFIGRSPNTKWSVCRSVVCLFVLVFNPPVNGSMVGKGRAK